ncbi:hypothetical protein D6C90_03580 [Aureobasidium pullulans]|uniref:Peptidase A1 domain-containing protein n=1 Tax=Aureobasidium pullulans TaxID=5580 RepID=A0A4V4KS95_AURPU|nr:hypothetical protein D6C90_03580 [Aureobasidium pullulans]
MDYPYSSSFSRIAAFAASTMVLTLSDHKPTRACFSYLSTVSCLLLFKQALAQSKINPDAHPWVLNYKSVGTFIRILVKEGLVPANTAQPVLMVCRPLSYTLKAFFDIIVGPWNAVSQLVDYPEQNLTFFPSLTQSSLFIQASACDTQDSACPLERTGMWTQSGAHSLSNWVNSTISQASTWDTLAEPLRLDGSAVQSADRIVLWSADRADGPYYLDGLAVTIASNYTVTYPEASISHTMDVGMLSLHTGSDTVNWTASNGSQVSYDPYLYKAYTMGDIPSISYGLHVGSVYPPVPGSLILGGYDRSRCISTPIVSSGNKFTLAEIDLEVTSGGWPFVKKQLASDSNLLLDGNTGSNSSLTVVPNPGVPYLYLPGNTCKLIASFLPVALDENLGLYVWNTTDPSFKRIMTSPSAIKFSFRTDPGLEDISVPFALLNLTLDYPLANTPKQYFPCSPYTPSDGSTYHLGRAFLQAAFLGETGQTQKVFLAQAPGPGAKDEVITKLASTDSTLTAMANPPTWNATWTDYLRALPDDSTSTTSSTPDGSKGLSGGAIAGIVIGAVGGIAIFVMAVFVITRRRRKSRKPQTVHWGGHGSAFQDKDDPSGEGPVSESASDPIYEVASDQGKRDKANGAAEMEVPGYIGELEGSYAYRRSQVLT